MSLPLPCAIVIYEQLTRSVYQVRPRQANAAAIAFAAGSGRSACAQETAFDIMDVKGSSKPTEPQELRKISPCA